MTARRAEPLRTGRSPVARSPAVGVGSLPRSAAGTAQPCRGLAGREAEPKRRFPGRLRVDRRGIGPRATIPRPGPGSARPQGLSKIDWSTSPSISTASTRMSILNAPSTSMVLLVAHITPPCSS